MLRRFARVLRGLLLGLAVLFVLWFPVCFFVNAELRLARPWGGAMIFASGGGLGIAILVWDSAQSGADFQAHFGTPMHSGARLERVDPGAIRPIHWPRYSNFKFSEGRELVVEAPLWLLAAVCLAWPVTSLILHRRRHKRGFPVEPNASVSEAPKLRQ